MPAPDYVVTKQFRGVIHFSEANTLLASRGSTILESTDGGDRWSVIATVPVGRLGAGRMRHRLIRRLLRSGVHHVVPSNADLVVAFDSCVTRFDRRRNQWRDLTSIAGSRPLGLSVMPDGSVIFGEYRHNAERTPVAVYRMRVGCRARREAEFTDVRHVHRALYDPYSGDVWVTTGDADRECWIWRGTFERGFERVVGGAQIFRAVDLLFTRDHVYYGSDNPHSRNAIFRLSRANGSVERVCDVRGTVFFACRTASELLFSTVCEPGSSEHRRLAQVWCSATGDHWEPIYSARKDRWPMRLFQYGQMRFPAGVPARVWVTPFAVEGDQTSLCLVPQ